jgi:aquaporin Z
MLIRKLVAELLGTAVLVFFAVGTATLAFGFHLQGGSTAAGVVMTSLAFGLVLTALVYAIGPVSGCHVNPAVTLGFVIAGRTTLKDAAGYWAAQLIGGIAGAFALWAVFENSDAYSCAATGLGTDGWGIHSMIGLQAGGAFLAEVILTFVFVLVVLMATRHATTAGFAGLAIVAAAHVRPWPSRSFMGASCPGDPSRQTAARRTSGVRITTYARVCHTIELARRFSRMLEEIKRR